MEIEGDDDSTLSLQTGAKTCFGRGTGFDTRDRTVSRCHVSFHLETAAEPVRVSFQVLGRNPIFVRSQTGGEIKVFRRFEKGELAVGDRFCVSGQRPVWFALKRREVAEESLSEVENGLESADLSDVDPVKEFGFLVIGKEFDQYPKNRIRDIKQWDWFLEEPRKDSGDDDCYDGDEKVVGKGKRGMGRKRTRGKERDDEDWTGESEDDKEVISKTRKVLKPTYSTRSKDRKKQKDEKKSRRGFVQGRSDDVKEEEEDEDDDNDDTLGGFIVNDGDDAELEEEDESSDGEEEEEEEFVDDDDDEDDEG